MSDNRLDNNSDTRLPNNIEAEKKVLGVMMLDEDNMYFALEKLDVSDFYDRANAIIFSAIKELAEKSIQPDPVMLSDFLESNGKFALIGGEAYIDSLAATILTGVKFADYVDLIAKKSQLRKLIKAAKAIEENAYNNEDASDVLEKAEKAIFDISVNYSKRSGFVSINEILQRVMQGIRDRDPNLNGMTGVNTGFTDLNYKFSGFQKNELIILAARPSMGKTALGLNFAMNAALDKNNDDAVAIFSLEMPSEQLAQRLLAAKSGVELNKIRTGDLSEDDFDAISLGIRAFHGTNIFISQEDSLGLMELRSKCRKLKAKHGLALVVIDYLQLMTGSGESQQIMVSNISKGLKGLAMEMECPIIALSQLSRKPEERKDHRPMLSDLRDSGSIEQDADIVMFLYRDEYYNKDNEAMKGLAEVIIAKHRKGETGTVTLNWMPEWQLFESAGGEYGAAEYSYDDVGY